MRSTFVEAHSNVAKSPDVRMGHPASFRGFAKGVGVLRLRRTTRFANRSAALRMTIFI
jgi:hypothetical protein